MGQNILDESKKKMEGALHSLKHSLSGSRTGRASVNLLDPIKAEVYGTLTPLTQISSVSAPEARMLLVQVWDRQNAKAVEKAILESGLGLNPISEGATLRIPIPDLTQERRKELSKKASEYSENSKVAVRNIRRDINHHYKKMEKSKEISEDELKSYSEKVQKMTDEFIQKIENTVEEKIKEIMGL